jgi:hypothetical protein
VSETFHYNNTLKCGDFTYSAQDWTALILKATQKNDRLSANVKKIVTIYIVHSPTNAHFIKLGKV